MATFTHYYPNTGNLSFSIEFDECEVTSEFSEMVYGSIDNTIGYALRSEVLHNERETDLKNRLTSLSSENQVMKEQLDLALQELADYKHDYIPPANRRNGVSVLDWHGEDLNNMGDKAYDKTNV